MTPHPPSHKPARKISYYLLLNVVLAIALVAAIPLIRASKDRYEPHAVVDREYVKNVIALGQQEEVNTALKLTEISRAVAFNDYVQMLAIMQVVAGLLAVMVIGNIIMLMRVRSLKAALVEATDETAASPRIEAPIESAPVTGAYRMS